MKSGCSSQKTEKKTRSVKLPVLQNTTDRTDGMSHSKTSRWRAAVLVGITLLMVAHVIQWLVMGRTISPIEPSESMYTLQNGAINAGFIFFSLAIIATLIFGRFVCGWGCHVLALQDFCAWLLKKIGLKPKPFRSRLLVFVPLIVALYMFVYPTAMRFFAAPKNEPIIPQFTNHLITTEFWATFPPVAVAIPFLFICGFMTVYFLGQKGFCTYACPYGGFFSLADKIAPGKIRVTDACNQCGHCTATCTSNVLVHSEVKEYGMVVDTGCMKCMDCVSVCPNDALYFGFGKPALGVPKKVKKNYSLTWVEEFAAVIIFAVSFFAVWDVYQLVPMLMALGIATITMFVSMRTWKIFRSKDLAFYRFKLKSAGKIQKAGFGFLAFAFVWTGLNIHSGFVHYHESAGASAFENIRIPDELALAQMNPEQWLSPSDRLNIESGKKHLAIASNVGFFTNKDALSKHAWVEYLSGETETGISLLEKAAENQNGQAKALSLYYRGAILNRAGRFKEAQESLDLAYAERPDLLLAREEKGESLWRMGKKQEAVAIWRETVSRNPGLPISNNFLAGAAIEFGQSSDAQKFERQADQYTPNDPYFHWMVGLRLQNVGMKPLAEKHFNKAIQLDPSFRFRKK